MSEKNAELEKKYKRSEEIVASNMDDEVVMMSIEQGKYFGLDPIASDIWKVLEEDKTAAQIVDAMVKKYDVARETCEEDVLAFLAQMQANNLVLPA